MKSFLARSHAGALLTFSLSLVVVSAVACGGTGTNLFGTGGAGGASASGTTSTGTASTSSGAGATSTSSSTGTDGTSSTGTAGTSSGGGAATTSSGGGAATTSSGAMTTSTTTSSGSVGCQAGYVCVDPDPGNGAFGYFYVNETMLPSNVPPPACPANLTAHTDFTTPAGPAQCTACSCGALEGAACSPPDMTCWSGSITCGGAAAGTDWTPALQDGMCDMPANLLNGANQLSCKITAAAMVTNQGSCAPSGGTFPNQGSWQTRVDACGVDQAAGSCGSGQVCIPQGSGDPGESLCVRYDGMSVCPAGWTKAIVAYPNATDTRACTACTCGDGATCGDSHYTFYDTANCTSASASGSINVGANLSNQCTDVTSEINQPSWSAKATLPQAHGQCPPGGGQPTGVVTPENPITYCCQ
jgi:hypothetical protein